MRSERKNPAAVALGSMRSARKAETARENGKLGGRPPKAKMKGSKTAAAVRIAARAAAVAAPRLVKKVRARA